MRLLFTFFSYLICSTLQTHAQQALEPTIDSGYFASFDGTKIYYESRGKGQPVVLVHGFIVNSTSWKRTALYNDLPQQGFQVIILDMRGNGKSDKPHDSTAYANDAEAKDIASLITYLSIKNYAVVGYSRGAIIASRLLLLDKRANAGVMGGMGTAFTSKEWPRRIMFYHALKGDPVPELTEVVKSVQKQGLDQLALAYLQKEQPSTSKEELNSIKQPVLVICGEQDEDFFSAGELSKMLSNGTFAPVPGGHNGAASTAEFSKAAIRFLHQSF